MEDDGRENGREQTVEREAERREGAVAVASLHGRRGAHGMGGGAHGEALGDGALDAAHACDSETGHSSEDARAHHYGRRQGRYAAHRGRYFHGYGRGDGFGHERHHDGLRGTEELGHQYHGDDAGHAAGHLGDEQRQHLLADDAQLLVERDAEGHDGRLEPEVDVVAAGAVGGVVHIGEQQDADEQGYGDEDGIEQLQAHAPLQVLGEDEHDECQCDEKYLVGKEIHVLLSGVCGGRAGDVV